ncbi:ABC transporter substrate-binding protein [Leucobacter sp. GX24907]
MLVLGAAATLLLTSCSNSSDAGDAEPSADGPLHVASFFAQTGPHASGSEPIIAATQLAINHINEAGGVFGQDVEFMEVDSTSDNETALAAADQIINSDTNIVVGPYTSGMSAALIGPITEAGMINISGSNTSSELTGMSERYFRTAPTDALEAARLTDLIASEGHTSVALIWQNDTWGKAFEESIVENLEAAGISIAANEPYNVEETDFNAQVNAAVASSPDAVVFLSYAVHTGAMVESLIGTNDFPSENVYFSSSTIGQYEDSLSDLSFLEGVQAYQPGALEEEQAQFESAVRELEPSLVTFAYAASTYDATILGALAAESAQSTDPDEIGAALTQISREDGGGEQCTTYADCLEILQGGGTINYDGITGPIEFDDNNDVGETNYLLFKYVADGTYEVQ